MKIQKKIWETLVSVLVLFCLHPQMGFADNLSLQNFLTQVKKNNQSARASSESALAAKDKTAEADQVTLPQLFASTQTGKDQRTGLFFPYDWVSSTVHSVGVQQQTSFGLTGKVSYTLTTQEYSGLPQTLLVSNPILAERFHEGLPKIELSQSLWRNSFGSETRALQTQIDAAYTSQYQTEIFKHKLTLTQASAAYWKLSLSREALSVAKETLERALRLSAWSSKRAGLGLGDRSDALQGEAAVQLRKLQLQYAQDEERAARLAFNSARGVQGDTVTESLENLPEPAQFIDKTSEFAPEREDLKAAAQGLRAAEASAQIGKSRNTPSLDLFASAALNSRNGEPGDAFADSFGTDQPTLGVGIKLTLPLDIGAWTRAQSGYTRDVQAAELQFQRKRFELNQEWKDLHDKLSEASHRYAIAVALENTQKVKSNYERERFNRGRSTTYQVLNFEEDYAQSRLNRIRSQFEIQALSLQLSTFDTTEGVTHVAR